MRAGSAATGRSPTRRAAAGSSPPPAATSSRRCPLLDEAVAQHEAVGDPFGRARALLALGVDAAAGAAEAAGPRGDRAGARRASRSSGRPAGRSGRARSSARSAAARAAKGLTPAERRVADLVANGTDERGGRGDALPRRADGGEPPDARVRQARRALADRAGRKLRTARQSSDVLTFPGGRPGRSVDGMPSYLDRDLPCARSRRRADGAGGAGTLGGRGADAGRNERPLRRRHPRTRGRDLLLRVRRTVGPGGRAGGTARCARPVRVVEAVTSREE